MKRQLTVDEQQADSLISQWAEWVRHENRAIAGGYGSMFHESGGSFEEQLPSWVDIEHVHEVNAVYLKFVTPARRMIVTMAWGIDRVVLESCRKQQGGIKTAHQAAFLKISARQYNAVLAGFRSAVVRGFCDA